MDRYTKRKAVGTTALVLALIAMPIFAMAGCVAQPNPTTIEETVTSAPEAALATRIVTVDINPSVQLEVDEAGLVVGVEPLNEDAVKVLETLQLEGLPATDAVKRIVAAAVALGYIDPAATDTYVAISVEKIDDDTDSDVQELEDDLQASAEEGLEENGAEGEVDVSAITQERIAAARELGMSPGRLNLIDRLAAALGQTREQVLATYGDSKVKEVMKALNAARPEGDESLDENDGDADEGDADDGEEDIEEEESQDQDEDIEEQDDSDETVEEQDDADKDDEEGDSDEGKHAGEKNHPDESTPTPGMAIS